MPTRKKTLKEQVQEFSYVGEAKDIAEMRDVLSAALRVRFPMLGKTGAQVAKRRGRNTGVPAQGKKPVSGQETAITDTSSEVKNDGEQANSANAG